MKMPAPLIATALLTETSKVVLKPVFEKFIEPHLSSVREYFEEKKIAFKAEVFQEYFIKYMNVIYEKSEFINVLIFPGEQIRIDDFYEPLVIESINREESFIINDTKLDFLVKYKKILIRDTAGMGKSTLMKWITRKIILNYLGIPVLIELRKLSSKNTIIDEIYKQLGQLGEELDEKFIIKLIVLGKFILILDGYDEISIENQDFVTNDILEFIEKAGQNYFIVTSRPEPALSSFGNFKSFKIKSLVEEQYNSIITRCDRVSNLNIGSSLIKAIGESKNDIHDFLVNPFLVTLLYNCYFYNRNIPSSKASFYDEIYSALYKHHDLSKDKFERLKRSGLDIYNFRLVLRKLALDNARINEADLSENGLVEAVVKAQEHLVGIPAFNALWFVEDLIKRVPLFVKEGLYVKWSHKSLQDYFAAECICYNDMKSSIVKRIYESSRFFKYDNIFDFILEMDYSVIRNTVLKDILTQYVENYNKNTRRFKFMSERELEIFTSFTTMGLFYVCAEKDEYAAEKEIDKRLQTGNYYLYARRPLGDGIIGLWSEMRSSIVVNKIKKQKLDDLFSYDMREEEMAYTDIPDITGVFYLNSLDSKYLSQKGVLGYFNALFDNVEAIHILDFKKCLKVLNNINSQIRNNNSEDALSY